jgi:hypothetical protein
MHDAGESGLQAPPAEAGGAHFVCSSSCEQPAHMATNVDQSAQIFLAVHHLSEELQLYEDCGMIGRHGR